MLNITIPPKRSSSCPESTAAVDTLLEISGLSPLHEESEWKIGMKTPDSGKDSDALSFGNNSLTSDIFRNLSFDCDAVLSLEFSHFSSLDVKPNTYLKESLDSLPPLCRRRNALVDVEPIFEFKRANKVKIDAVGTPPRTVSLYPTKRIEPSSEHILDIKGINMSSKAVSSYPSPVYSLDETTGLNKNSLVVQLKHFPLGRRNAVPRLTIPRALHYTTVRKESKSDDDSPYVSGVSEFQLNGLTRLLSMYSLEERVAVANSKLQGERERERKEKSIFHKLKKR